MRFGIVYDRDTKEVMLQHYQSQPVMLTNAQREDKKK